MAAGIYNTSFRTGETFGFSLLINVSAGGPAQDLTGATFDMSIQLSTNPATKYFFASYFSVATPSNGIVTLSVPASLTSGITPGRYNYDFKYVNAAGVVKYYMSGYIDVIQAVTT